MANKKIDSRPGKIPKKHQETAEKQDIIEAHDQAEKDIEKDPDLNLKPRHENDLDEGELARFERED